MHGGEYATKNERNEKINYLKYLLLIFSQLHIKRDCLSVPASKTQRLKNKVIYGI